MFNRVVQWLIFFQFLGAYVPYGLVGRAFENLGGGVQVPRHSGVHPGDHLIVVEHLFIEYCPRKNFFIHLFCAQRVKEMASFNWQSYNFDFYGMDQMEPPPGHLLLYPVQVGCTLALV